MSRNVSRSPVVQTLAVLIACFVAFPEMRADDKRPVVPQPRKRLGPQPSKEITKGDGKSVVGDVQTIEKQFLNTFQSYVAATYERLTARLPDEPSLSVHYWIRMKLDTETNVPGEIKIEGSLTERRRLLLLEAISQTCRSVICPTELRKKYGKVLDFSFDLWPASNPESGEAG